jgi:hypothetical protein
MSLQSNDVSIKHFLYKVAQKCWNKETFPDKAVDLVTVDLEDAHSSPHLTDSDGLPGGRLGAVLPTLTNISRPVYTALQASEKVSLPVFFLR